MLSVPDLEVDIHGENVVATYPSVLSLSCSAQAVLNYCWFRNPSGLPLFFSTDIVYSDGFRPRYVYKDTLSQGVCTITLQYTTIEDSGEWTCNMGVPGRSDEDYPVLIKVGISGRIEKFLYHG